MRIIIDLPWILYRSYYTFQNFSFIDGSGKLVPTGGMYGVLRQHQSLIEKFPNAEFMYAIEPEENHRYSIDMNYKTGRNHSPESKRATYGMLEEIKSMLKLFPRTSVWTAEVGEADDVIYTLALQDPGNSQVFSADNDLLVLMDKGVKIFRVIKADDEIVYIDDAYIQKSFGMIIRPAAIPLYKIIRGDRSDKIPVAVERFPTRLLETVLKNCNTVDELLASVAGGVLAEEKLTRFLDAEAKLRHNEKLVQLMVLPIYEDDYTPRDMRYFITNYGLKSLRKSFNA